MFVSILCYVHIVSNNVYVKKSNFFKIMFKRLGYQIFLVYNKLKWITLKKGGKRKMGAKE